MIKSTELRKKLEEIMEFITKNYSPAHYDPKSALDLGLYKEAKKLYEEAEDALYSEEIDWSYPRDEDDDVIHERMDKLWCEIEMMEEDLGISILKNMFDAHLNKIFELEKDFRNEEARDEANWRRNIFSDKLKSLGITKCGYDYDGSSFVVYYEDGRIESITFTK